MMPETIIYGNIQKIENTKYRSVVSISVSIFVSVSVSVRHQIPIAIF